MLNISLSHDLTIYAYGATIKKADLSGTGWLQLQGGKGIKAIYAGGIIDGNQQNQTWIGNPKGGKYSTKPGHNCLLAGVGMDFFYAKDVSLKNIVMDGIRSESNTLGVISNCSSDNAANFHYNDETGANGQKQAGARDQGTAFKGRFDGDNQAVLLLDSISVGGSIGYQSSFPQNLKKGEWIPENILTLIANTILSNGAQDNFHLEDTSYAFLYKVVTDCLDDGKFYQPRGWVSNSTRIFHALDCNFNNTVINFRNKTSMKLCIITGGSTSSSMKYSSTAVQGNVDIVANAIIKGTKVEALNSINVQLQNGGSISGAKNNDKTILDSTIDIVDNNGNKIGTLGVNSTVPTPIPDPVPVPDPIPTPTAPGAFTLTAVIGMNWKVSERAKSYDVKRAPIATEDYVTIATDVTGTTYTDNTILSGENHKYKITAKNEFGSTDSDVFIEGAVEQIPTPPPTTPDPVPDPIPDPVPTPETSVIIGLLPYQHSDNLGLPIGRNRFVVSTGNGLQPMLRYTGKMKFIPSAVWESKAFPTDINIYEQKLQVLADNVSKDKMPFFALENEPMFKGGSFAMYAQMMRSAIKIFKDKGIDVFVGGITFPALAAICAQLYSKDTPEWQVFKNHGFTAANSDSITFIQQYLDDVQENGLPIHFNFHVNIAPDTLAVLPLVVAKLRQLAGDKKIMCGECSFSNQSAFDVTTALTIMKDIDYILLYSEEEIGGGDGLAKRFNAEMDNAVKSFLQS
jgi:hypothetical protein